MFIANEVGMLACSCLGCVLVLFQLLWVNMSMVNTFLCNAAFVCLLCVCVCLCLCMSVSVSVSVCMIHI